MTPLEAYEKTLADLPGSSPRNVHQILCHKWGLIAGLPKSQIIEEIRQAWGGGRQPTDRELERAHKVGAEEAGKPYDATSIKPATPRRPQEVQTKITRRTFEKLAGDPLPSSALAALSPIDIGSPGNRSRQIENATLLLRSLYRAEEYIFCGPQNGTSDNVLPVGEWIERIRQGNTEPQFIMNPLTGGWGPKANEDGQTRRGRNTIADYRFTLFEIDTIGGEKVPLALQARFLWNRITEGWPIRAVIYSGGKSLHAIVQVNETRDTWAQNVEKDLFSLWADMGADPKVSTPERQARLPGHTEEGRKLQSLLWLCPEGWTYAAPQPVAKKEPLGKELPKAKKEPEPYNDPDGFTRDQRQKLDMVQSVFDGHIIRIEEPSATATTASATCTATHTQPGNLRAVLDSLEAVVMQAMEGEAAGYDESPSAYIRWHSQFDRRGTL